MFGRGMVAHLSRLIMNFYANSVLVPTVKTDITVKTDTK